MRVTRKSTKKDILKNLSSLKSKSRVKIGVLHGKYPDGTNIALVAYWNEFGTKHSPSRPFMRTTLFANNDYDITTKKIAKKVIAGEVKMRQGLDMLGQIVKQDIQNTIDEIRSPANSKATIARKGSSNPLIDTGTMMSAIDYEVIEA